MTSEEEIFNKLRSAEALPFLFVGSGLSRRYLGSDNWENLLRRFSLKVNPSPYYFEKIREKAKSSLHSEGKDSASVSILYPKIADYIEAEFNMLWYDAPEYEEIRKKYTDHIRRGVSPIKIEIAEYCRQICEHPFLLQNEIELLKKLSSNSVAGIITTNYDFLLEILFPDFLPYVGQDELVFSSHQSIGEIYKIHGSCTRPESIVLNSRDYDEFERKNAYLAAKLLTTFVEHPIIFLGYSLQDENVQHILQAITDCLGEKLSTLKDRLIFVEWVSNAQQMEVSPYSKDFGARKTLEMTRVTLSNYCELYEILLNNKSKYPTKLLRQIKQDIYSLTLTTDPKTRLVALNTSRAPKEGDEIEYVFGFGVLELGKKGYQSVHAEDLYHDILFDDSHFIVDLLIEYSLPTLMSTCGINLPVYKYISQYNRPLPEKYIKFKNFEFKNFITHSLRKLAERHQYHSIEDISANHNLSLNHKLNCIIALPQLEINAESLHSFLVKLFEDDPGILSSNVKSQVKKLIRMYDWIKYKKQ